MKRTLYLLALALAVVTAVGYVVGKGWEEEAQMAEAEMSFVQKFNMWKRQAKNGDADAQYRLGVYFDTERTNYLHAQKWYRVAATKGQHSGAQYKLGQLYMNGRGVENDLPAAMHWFRKSANLGDARGQFFVGISYRDGWERKPNFIEAYKWFYLANKDADLVRAEDPRFDPTEALAELEKKMSRFDIEKAVELANKWRRGGK